MRPSIYFIFVAFLFGFLSLPVKDLKAAQAGDLIKCPDYTSVYYLAEDGKRWVFPNAQTYFTWYDNFDDVVEITCEELGNYSIGSVVTYQPGTRLVKIQSVPNVYAIEPGGVLRQIQSETQAQDLYGTSWNQRIDDVSDGFWSSYSEGDPLSLGQYPIGAIIKSTGSSLYYYMLPDESLRRLTTSWLTNVLTEYAIDKSVMYIDNLFEGQLSEGNWEMVEQIDQVLMENEIQTIAADPDQDFVAEVGWQTETVDDDGWVGIDPMIAVDLSGYPHIAYYDQCNRDLKYAVWNGGSWQVEIVDSTGDVGEEAGIGVDRNGNPHISYVDVTTGSLKYATKTDGFWSLEIVDGPSSSSHLASTSLALDSNGNPRIGYTTQPNGEGPSSVKYASWNGNTWSIETVTTKGQDVYLALDANGQPHLSFRKEDSSDIERIYYATKSYGVWSVESPDSSVRAGGDTGIAVDSNNQPHLVYHDYDNGSIKYAGWSGSSWTIRTVDASVTNEEGLKIAIDSSDRPNVIYSNMSDMNDERLIYAVWGGSSWSTETVSRPANPAIAIDYLDRVHIAHNSTVEESSSVSCPNYTGSESEIEILKYSIRE
ncbi:MAG: hypothetical protein V1695_03525 [Candidatus Uhrbacteria bacterium]